MTTWPAGYSVCITTARRNDFLGDLLASIERQTWLPAPFEVIVVDNNPDGSARAVVEARTRPWRCQYLHCAVPSIPVARNAAVGAACYANVVLVDDDQLLPQDLFRMLDKSWRGQRDATGAGLFRRRLQFEPGVSIWAKRGGVDAPLDYPHGAVLPPSHGHTGGVVVRRDVFDRVQFDRKWGLLGCDDNAFFKSVGAIGFAVVYLRDVEIVERIQPGRATFPALMVQGYHQGLCFARVELQPRRSGPAALFLLKSLAAFCVYVLLVPVSFAAEGRGVVRTLKRVVRQVGKISGVLGFSYEYYAE